MRKYISLDVAFSFSTFCNYNYGNLTHANVLGSEVISYL